MVQLSAEGSKGWAIWITGLPGSGKSVVARRLWIGLSEMGIRSQIISSDALRKILTPKPKYSEEEREMVYSLIAFIAKILTDNGVNVLIDATGNRRRYRDSCRSQISSFLEVYLRCPLEVCMGREESRAESYLAPKDIYRKARSGESCTVPGFGAPYEAPERPEILVDSDRQSPEEIVQVIIGRLSEKGLLNSRC